MSISPNYYLLLAILLVSLIIEIFADQRECRNGTKCPSDMYCCSSGCCYDDSEHPGYNVGYRMTIWNMWYFWFIVIFVLMACFSGCGYYKQRQRLLRSQHSGTPGIGFFSVFHMRPGNQGYHSNVSATRNTDLEQQTVQPQVAANQIGFWSMFRVPSRHRPGSTGIVSLERGYRDNLQTGHSPPEATLQPPPYTEVVNNPDLFPPNTKTDLPPYNQQPVVTAAQTGSGNQSRNSNSSGSPPQPPPYTEVASQNSAMYTATI